MTTELTTWRRRVAAAAATLALLVLPGCAALDDGAEPEPGAAPAVTAPAAPSPAPSVQPTVAPSVQPSVPPSASPGDEPTGEPPAAGTPTEPAGEPSTEPSSDATTGPDGTEDEKGPDGDTDGTGTQEEKEPEHLARGASGERVVALQQRLQELGYFLLEADGAYGPATQQAVWALQKAAGLYRDGVVGPRTQDALDRGVRPTPVSSSGKVVEIDLDRQLLLAVEDGRVVRTINASSGNGEQFEAQGRSYRASTPRGTFAVYMERDYLHESTLELGSMYRPKYFTGAIAVHGSPSIPPFPASHGCVRVSNAAMNWLWDTWGMPKGTTVVVH